MMLNNKKTGLISLFTLLLIHATVSFADAPVNQSPNLEASQQNQHVFSQQDYQEDFNLFLCTRQISQNPYPIRILPS